MKMFSPSGHPRFSFMETDLEKFKPISCSLIDPLQWMGAVRMRVQTSDKNISIIHTTPVHRLMTCEVKRCVFVRNKSIIKTSESGEKYAQIKHCLQANTRVDFDVRGQQEKDFFTGGNVHYWLCWLIFLPEASLKLKCLDGFVSHNHAAFHFTRH